MKFSIGRHARILRLQPGDAVVYRTQHRLTMEQADLMRRLFEAALPGHEVLIIDDGADIEIARGDERGIDRDDGPAPARGGDVD